MNYTQLREVYPNKDFATIKFNNSIISLELLDYLIECGYSVSTTLDSMIVVDKDNTHKMFDTLHSLKGKYNYKLYSTPTMDRIILFDQVKRC